VKSAPGVLADAIGAWRMPAAAIPLVPVRRPP